MNFPRFLTAGSWTSWRVSLHLMGELSKHLALELLDDSSRQISWTSGRSSLNLWESSQNFCGRSLNFLVISEKKTPLISGRSLLNLREKLLGFWGENHWISDGSFRNILKSFPEPPRGIAKLSSSWASGWNSLNLWRKFPDSLLVKVFWIPGNVPCTSGEILKTYCVNLL